MRKGYYFITYYGEREREREREQQYGEFFLYKYDEDNIIFIC